MTTTVITTPVAGSATTDINRRMLRGMMYREWLIHGWWITLAAVSWFIGVWALELFSNWILLLIFGMIYAFVSGPALGGADVREGCEEFCFALPPTRRQRFLLRLALGGIPLVFMMGIGVLAIGFDLPQAAWGLVVESGLTEPYRADFLSPACVCALLLPVSMYLVGFCVAALARSNGRAQAAPWLALAVTAVPVGIAALIRPPREMRVMAVLLLVSVVSAIYAGYCGRLYERKEGHTRQTEVEAGMPAWARSGIALLVVLLLFLAFFVVRVSSH